VREYTAALLSILTPDGSEMGGRLLGCCVATLGGIVTTGGPTGLMLVVRLLAPLFGGGALLARCEDCNIVGVPAPNIELFNKLAAAGAHIFRPAPAPRSGDLDGDCVCGDCVCGGD
jgi:hypothetical protein